MTKNYNPMFSTFNTELPTTFSPNNYQTQFNCKCSNPHLESINPNKPYEVKDMQGNLVGYYWYYGDSITFEFDINGEITLLESEQYLSYKDILESLTFFATFYNFRKEPIITFSSYPLSEHLIKKELVEVTDEVNNTVGKVIIGIDKELSNELFIRGVYYLSLEATYPNGYSETLFSPDSCSLEVK